MENNKVENDDEEEDKKMPATTTVPVQYSRDTVASDLYVKPLIGKEEWDFDKPALNQEQLRGYQLRWDTSNTYTVSPFNEMATRFIDACIGDLHGVKYMVHHVLCQLAKAVIFQSYSMDRLDGWKAAYHCEERKGTKTRSSKKKPREEIAKQSRLDYIGQMLERHYQWVPVLKYIVSTLGWQWYRHPKYNDKTEKETIDNRNSQSATDTSVGKTNATDTGPGQEQDTTPPDTSVGDTTPPDTSVGRNDPPSEEDVTAVYLAKYGKECTTLYHYIVGMARQLLDYRYGGKEGNKKKLVVPPNFMRNLGCFISQPLMNIAAYLELMKERVATDDYYWTFQVNWHKTSQAEWQLFTSEKFYAAMRAYILDERWKDGSTSEWHVRDHRVFEEPIIPMVDSTDPKNPKRAVGDCFINLKIPNYKEDLAWMEEEPSCVHVTESQLLSPEGVFDSSFLKFAYIQPTGEMNLLLPPYESHDTFYTNTSSSGHYSIADTLTSYHYTVGKMRRSKCIALLQGDVVPAKTVNLWTENVKHDQPDPPKYMLCPFCTHCIQLFNKKVYWTPEDELRETHDLDKQYFLGTAEYANFQDKNKNYEYYIYVGRHQFPTGMCIPNGDIVAKHNPIIAYTGRSPQVYRHYSTNGAGCSSYKSMKDHFGKKHKEITTDVKTLDPDVAWYFFSQKSPQHNYKQIHSNRLHKEMENWCKWGDEPNLLIDHLRTRNWNENDYFEVRDGTGHERGVAADESNKIEEIGDEEEDEVEKEKKDGDESTESEDELAPTGDVEKESEKPVVPVGAAKRKKFVQNREEFKKQGKGKRKRKSDEDEEYEDNKGRKRSKKQKKKTPKSPKGRSKKGKEKPNKK